MPLRDKTKKVALCGLFLAMAVAASLLERWIPFDFAVPGVKLGLANVVVLCALYLFSPAEAFGILLLKCAAGALFAGGFVSFLYSLCGSVLSFFVMWLLQKKASPFGVSAAGGAFHNVGQLLCAWLLFRSAAVFSFLPFLLFFGTLSGMLIGIIGQYLIGFFPKKDA